MLVSSIATCWHLNTDPICGVCKGKNTCLRLSIQQPLLVTRLGLPKKPFLKFCNSMFLCLPHFSFFPAFLRPLWWYLDMGSVQTLYWLIRVYVYINILLYIVNWCEFYIPSHHTCTTCAPICAATPLQPSVASRSGSQHLVEFPLL